MRSNCARLRRWFTILRPQVRQRILQEVAEIEKGVELGAVPAASGSGANAEGAP